MRLEAAPGWSLLDLSPHFNTSKVRLEGAFEGSPCCSEKIFQYLEGAIGGPSVDGLPARDRMSFNTSKVRLEGAPLYGAVPTGLTFNTSKVRLEVVEVALGFLQDPPFNTSKVRLEGLHRDRLKSDGQAFNTSKVRLEGTDMIVRYVSQDDFQYLEGAIGGRSRHRNAAPESNFQYLEGAIGGAFVGDPTVANGDFQYLEGAIGGARRSDQPHPDQPLSIPRRCDWRRRRRCGDGSGPVFQYLEGAIGGPSRCVNKVPLRGAAGRFVGPRSTFNIVIPRFCVNPGRVTRLCNLVVRMGMRVCRGDSRRCCVVASGEGGGG